MSTNTEEKKTMELNLEDHNISEINRLVKPHILKTELAVNKGTMEFVLKSRKTVQNIIDGTDKRLLFIVGPCSIHDPNAAFEYAIKLREIIEKVKDKIFIVMRTYFEKPRTTIGWKGLINDPDLNNTYDVNKGLYLARKLLLEINNIGVPCGYEILDSITPQYIADLISWGAIGARTTESQVHRQIVSGLSMPVGFKNGTDGNIKIALDAVVSSKNPHCFMGISAQGEPSICKTRGNKYCHIILRGGTSGPNFMPEKINDILTKIDNYNNDNLRVNKAILVDCSHGNSGKDYRKQNIAFKSVIEQVKNGNNIIKGGMIESNINYGNQKLQDPEKLLYGVSITDSCISLEETEELMNYALDKLI
tara:strand:+ start:248 stop:1336 length:1089 start_codon:yes stop_codon:yes gene_type:complete